MSLIEFPYTLHKHYLMPIIPVMIAGHKFWVFVDSGATFSIFGIDDARRIGIKRKGAGCKAQGAGESVED
jgi:predicted aspartyl protease